jgi:protein SCO1/2
MQYAPYESAAMNTTQSRSLLEPRRAGAIGIIVILIALLVAVGLPRLTSGDEAQATVDVERKQVLDPPKELADFTLTGQDGQPLSLSDLRGKPTLLFFGFTHCPDICPTTLAQFRQVKRDLGERGSDVNFVFISVDGSRDTPEVVKAYVDQFDPEFVGLTGTEDKVRAIGGDYFVFFNRAQPEGTPSAAGYSVDHTTYTYLIDAEGSLRVIYPFQAPREMVVEDIEGLLTS